ncbi:MAG: PilX N-terminal domain-containing pilus assembly protein [Akkermansiaceae bacterium]
MNIHPPSTSSHRQRGAVLLVVIVVIIIVAVLGASVVTLSKVSQRSALSVTPGNQAFYLAESGLRYAQHVHHAEGWPPGHKITLTLQSGEGIEVERSGNYFWATSVVKAGTAQEARARVPVKVANASAHPN